MPPPDRWEEYQPLGSVIPGTKFIAFKVPLKDELCRNLPENLNFSPSKLIELLTDSGKSLGLVVDLTFTHRYYNGKEFTRRSIRHEKIFTRGHEVPSEDVYSRFGEVVDAFCEEHGDSDILIGVHCTHGVNRTGYLVCRYMIERLKIPPEEAITLFNEARGHPLERENYIKDLKTRPRPGDPELPLSVPRDFSQLDFHRKSADRRHHPQSNRSVHDRPPPTKHQKRPQGRDLPYDRPNRGQGRRGYHDDRRYPRHDRSSDSHHSGNGSHISPLSRLEGPPQPSWGSGCAGWGAPVASRSSYGPRNVDSSGGDWQRWDRGHHSSARSFSHPYSRQNDERYPRNDDRSQRSRLAHWERGLHSNREQYTGGQRGVKRSDSWRQGSGPPSSHFS
ncbi:hypothetical protein BaRGS_00032307 [Batillaria attramentaria]|uniref:RNA/RNP complex-1-interacting phosphatase n=1 Tax=Batillaria attramentaria TaxID=370345 RepID=A0ABD0JNH1_9CAEN